jgi:hypothetical protein
VELCAAYRAKKLVGCSDRAFFIFAYDSSHKSLFRRDELYESLNSWGIWASRSSAIYKMASRLFVGQSLP